MNFFSLLSDMIFAASGVFKIMFEWHLIRTKPGKERKVRERLNSEVSELFLPLLKTRTRRREKLVDLIVPLFPGYLFGQFDVQSQYRRVRYTPGIREVLSAGGELLVVPRNIIEDLKQRCAGGPIEIPQQPLICGERVRVVEGPLRGLDAVLEGYLPGNERVRILLSSLSNAGPRVVLASSSIAEHAEY